MSKRAIYRIIWVISLLAIIGMDMLFILQPHAAPTAAATQVHFTTQDQFISVDHPSNWKPQAVEDHGVATTVVFLPNESTRCLIKTDLVGSLMADVAKSGSGMGNLPGMPGMPGMPSGGSQKSTLETVHAYQGKNMMDDIARYPGYEEGKTIKVRVAGTEALFTQFTYRKTTGIQEREMIGRRISALAGDRRLAIVTNCRKDQAGTLEPIFQKIIDSIKIGQGG